jgi:hypothetical protein
MSVARQEGAPGSPYHGLNSWFRIVQKEREKMATRYRVHRFNLRMTADQTKLEQFLNNLEGEVVAIIPNVTPFPATFVDFVLIVEKIVR